MSEHPGSISAAAAVAAAPCAIVPAVEIVDYSPREEVQRSRRQLLALGVFGLLTLLLIVVYGWLLYGSLVARERQTLIREARTEAELVAAFVEREVSSTRDRNLLLAIATGSTRPVLDEGLAAHPGIAAVEIRDQGGAVIFADRRAAEQGLRIPDPGKDPSEDGPARDDRLGEVLEVPIGAYGSLLLALDPLEERRRIAELRSAIAGRTATMLIPLLALLALGGIVLWRSYDQSREDLERVRHTERMAYIGTLAAGLAHEIRSPLNSLSLNMQMLDEDIARLEPEASGRRLLEITRAEIDRLERLVTEFLNYARPRPLEFSEVPALQLIERVVELVRGGLEARGVEVRVEDHSEGATLFVDPAQMHQLLLNLTENAAQATERIRRPAWIEYVVSADDDAVRIQVLDNGRGMLAEDLDQATEIFFSRRKGGTGLGLAIVDRIVKSHEGRLRIESEFGVGTTVTVEIPRRPPADGTRPRVAPDGA